MKHESKNYQKKTDLQTKMAELRWDTSKEDDQKEMELKNLSDEINDTEAKLIEQVKASISAFVNLLELPASVKAVYDDRKKVKAAPISPPSSPRKQSQTDLPIGPPGELPFFRTTSSTKKLSSPRSPRNSKRGKGGINLLFDKISPKEEEPRSELEVLEQEINELRAALLKATSEKKTK